MLTAGNEEWRTIRHHHISDLFYHGISLLSRRQRAQPGLLPRLFFVQKCRNPSESGGICRPLPKKFHAGKKGPPTPGDTFSIPASPPPPGGRKVPGGRHLFPALPCSKQSKAPDRLADGPGPCVLVCLLVQILVGVIVILRAEFPAQPALHAAAADRQIMPAADQQADEGRQGQAGTDDLHDHACSFAHRGLLLFRMFSLKFIWCLYHTPFSRILQLPYGAATGMSSVRSTSGG